MSADGDLKNIELEQCVMVAKAKHQNSLLRTKKFAFSKRHLLLLSIWPAFCLGAGGMLWKTVDSKLEESKASVIQQAFERTTVSDP